VTRVPTAQHADGVEQGGHRSVRRALWQVLLRGLGDVDVYQRTLARACSPTDASASGGSVYAAWGP
jgi:hypothetical protein